MATVFFDSEGLLLMDIMPHGTTINSDGYVANLKKLLVRLSRVRRHREKQDVLLLHDNAQPYVSHKTTDQIRKFGQTTLKHPPYSPELAPCDYHLFGKLKDPFAERGQKMTPLCTLLKSGSDALVQTFTVLVYRPSFLGYVRQLKGTGIMWKSDILFLEDASTFCENSKAVG